MTTAERSTTRFCWTPRSTWKSTVVADRECYWTLCRACNKWLFAGFERRMPRHTRRVWGVGWGGKPMHMPCIEEEA